MKAKEMFEKLGYELVDTNSSGVKLKDYITNLQEKIEYNDLVLKALHKYFIEHEFYEIHEFLRQLESCTESDMVWLKRMAGVNNER